MIKQSLLCSLLLCSFAFAGEKTGNFLYYFTKGACYTGAVAAIVTTIPATSAVASVGLPTAVMSTTAMGCTAMGAGSMSATSIVLAASTKGKFVAAASLAASESLAQKAYELGKKF
jgi:hypothetical protein